VERRRVGRLAVLAVAAVGPARQVRHQLGADPPEHLDLVGLLLVEQVGPHALDVQGGGVLQGGEALVGQDGIRSTRPGDSESITSTS
jgi:hypothetical protein